MKPAGSGSSGNGGDARYCDAACKHYAFRKRRRAVSAPEATISVPVPAVVTIRNIQELRARRERQDRPPPALLVA